MRCTFCATGSGGFARNLTASEIVDQVLTVQEHFATRVSNVGARACFSGPPRNSRELVGKAAPGRPQRAKRACL